MRSIFALVNAETRGFSFSRARRTHGESGDAYDAMFLAEQIERLRRFLGEADDTFGIRAVRHHASLHSTICNRGQIARQRSTFAR